MNAHPTQQPPVRADRPGAMTTAMQSVHWKPSGPRALRIGVIQGERIVEERVVRERETVTVGTSEKNHFVINHVRLAARFELFQLVGNDYVLNFTDAMSGRVGLPGSVQDLAQLRSGGGARNAGSHFQAKLNDNSRGKIVIGSTTLLFQFVPLPANQPRPQLPAATRGGLVRSIDWLFTALVMFSFMSAFGFIVYLENYDAPIDRGIAALSDSIAEILFAEPPPPVDLFAERDPDGDEVPTADMNDASSTPPPQHAQSKPSPADAPDPQLDPEVVARLAKEAAQQADALIVGALSAATDGLFADVLAGGAVVGGAEEILAQATGIGVASSSGGELRTRSGGGDGSGHTVGLGSLQRKGGIAATAARGEGHTIIERVVAETKLGRGGDIGGTGDFDSATVVNMIKIRMGAIKACYERSLKQNPALAGKVTVEFTIVPAGTVTASRVAANTTGDDSVAQCVVSTIDSLRFKPGPEGGNVVYSYPFVFAPSN